MAESDPIANLIELSGGSFLMGNELDAYPADGEGPVREVFLSSFAISSTAVTNEEFKAFVADTNYVTTAEQSEDGSPPWSFVFAGLLPDDFPPTRGVLGAEWWRQVEGADWLHPEGPGSELEPECSRWNHPVVHISWFDAKAFAEWAGCRLPTEAEWEFAARGDLNQKRFPWGDESKPGGDFMCNILLVLFLTKTMLKMVGLELVLSMLFLQIILVFITVQGTFGSGVMIGFPHVMNQISRSETRRAL